MKIAVMQPYLFPYVGYFQLINSVDRFIVYDDVNFIKKGWINRNRICSNGKEYMFTVPLKKVSQNKKINEIEISDDHVWRNKLLKTFQGAYGKAPCFKEAFPLLEEIIFSENNNLSRYVTHSIKKINSYLRIETDIIESSVGYKTGSLNGKEKILEICRQENADEYINPIGGMELYNKKDFENNGIKLSFLKTDEIIYNRMNQSFIPFLSIIDVMMFNNSDQLKKLINKYELI